MKKLFGCVCVCRLLFLLFIFSTAFSGLSPSFGNNIRVEGKTRVVSVVGDTAVLEVTLRWDNSWRDDFNWDGAWVFFKFKKRGLENPWQHVYLSSSGHVLSASAGNEGGGYAYMVGANGGKVNGLYVMRDGISEGNVSVRLRAKWTLAGSGLTSSDFGDALNGIYVAVHAIEMVYVPYGAYYLGDGFSRGSLQNKVQGAPLPADYDIIDNNSGYEYSIKNTVVTGPVENIADRNAAAAWPTSSLYFNAVGGGWVQVDFKTPKTIRYFGVSAASNYCSGSQDCRPKGNWYLTGSNDLLTWDRLYTGVNTDWRGTNVAYPVQNTLKVTHPGSYRYYRIEMSGAVRTDDGIVIQSIAMTEKDWESCIVDSENALALASIDNTWSGTLSASYPKGYAGFYVMKYETSQEQYVEFLNSLTLEQQKARVANNNFSTMKRGDYVFGDLKNPNCRNGIVFIEQRKPNTPVVFGNNLNPNNDLFSSDDGQTLACNYMSVEDMIAYCSWSGLRPMSELEYEKACRRPYPQLPEQGEYAWNTNSGINALSSLGDLAYLGDEREQALSAAKNVNSGMGNRINGPVRCGLFATSSTSQSQSGATYWGVMDMSGNLKELCVSVGNPNFNGGSCGTGVYNAAYWNTAAGSYGVRGGGFNSRDSLLRTSDRTEAMNYFASITQRDSTVGFRGVYGLSGINIEGGKILGDTICPGNELRVVNVQEAFCPDFQNMRFQYNWYVKKPGEAKFDIVPNATDKTLKYEYFENTTTSSVIYTFKRAGICAMGVAESNEVTVTILPKPFAQDVYDFNAGSSVTLTQYWGTNASAQWWLEGAPTWAYVSGTTANALTIAGGLANLEFTVKSKLAECPSDEFSATVRINGTFPYTGHMDSVTLAAGKYKMECWGARGGGGYNTGGYGGYASGELVLSSNETFYIHVGQQGTVSTAATYGGGGGGGKSNRGWGDGGQGGGATDIRTVSSVWNDATGLCSRIMVAGGGGGGQQFHGNGYYNAGSKGGTGGGISGGNTSAGSGATVAAGTQTTGYLFGIGRKGRNSTCSGPASCEGNGGGGGGYYGGQAYTSTAARSDAGGAGGSGFVSGMAGCNAVNASGIHTGSPNHYSGYVFTNCSMSNGARNGAGEVKITPVD